MRLCRECGQPIETRRMAYGRTTSKGDWWVHIDTDNVPCDPALKAAHRQAQQEAQA